MLWLVSLIFLLVLSFIGPEILFYVELDLLLLCLPAVSIAHEVLRRLENAFEFRFLVAAFFYYTFSA